jgi:hypothetical protein
MPPSNPWIVEPAASRDALAALLNRLNAEGYYTMWVLAAPAGAFTVIARRRGQAMAPIQPVAPDKLPMAKMAVETRRAPAHRRRGVRDPDQP